MLKINTNIVNIEYKPKTLTKSKLNNPAPITNGATFANEYSISKIKASLCF